MSDERSPVDVALDVFVYAPVGIAYEALDAFPRFARRGRGQVGLARVAGKTASRRGESEVHKVASSALTVISGLLGGGVATPTAPKKSNGNVPEGYDAMTAQEVIALLDTLGPADLAAVAQRERSARRRVTVLRRIDQLDTAR